MSKQSKASCLKRLSRIEGQVRGLARMVEEDRYCIDVVTQISAVRAALRRVEEEVLRDHIGHCVEHAIVSGDAAEQRRKIAELMDVLSRSGALIRVTARRSSSGLSRGSSHPQAPEQADRWMIGTSPTMTAYRNPKRISA